MNIRHAGVVIVADLAGVAFIFLVQLLAGRFVPSLSWGSKACIVSSLVLGLFSVLYWRYDKAPDTTDGWLKLAAGSIAIGGVFFTLDLVAGRLLHPALSTLSAATGYGGFIITLFICPIVTTVAISGAIRSWVLGTLTRDLH